MGTYHVNIYTAVLDHELNSPDGMVGRYLAEKGSKIVVAAKRQAGSRTGRLRASIHLQHMQEGRMAAVKIGSSVGYALLHHEGSRPHAIVAKRAKTLRFAAGGRIIYTRAVAHPGTRANRYLSDNLILIK